MSNARAGILFTAFEPSGDVVAASAIAALRRIAPEVPVFAFGGPRMEAAGATLLEPTATDGSMALAAWKKIPELRRAQKRMREVIATLRIGVHVPVDSSSANFPLCRIAREHSLRIVHLVAPQLWASRPWRAKTLQKLTDQVLCVLPFEPAWFRERGIPAVFIGHPCVNRSLDAAALALSAKTLPVGDPRIVLLPGSRRAEVRANLPLLVDTFVNLAGRYRRAVGVIALAREDLRDAAQRARADLPSAIHTVVDALDPALHWGTMAIGVSGTVSLDVARHGKPLVGVYRMNPILGMCGKMLLTTKFRLLPNILAQSEIVPEFVPYSGGSGHIADAASDILTDTRVQSRISAQLRKVVEMFGDQDPGEEAAKRILQVAGYHSSMTT
ncbi:MAG: hypothetical protein O2800_01720 [Planctomycetota bacterium]|nr:hypothetical protein [Planctomycetota bacterium]